MVDFSTPKRRSKKSRSNGLFVAALAVIGLVAYAFVDGARAPHSMASGVSASLTEQ